MKKERIAGIRPDEIGRPVGAYRVELLDRHTGRVRDRVEASNYISPLLLQRLRWSQAMSFHDGLRYAHLGSAWSTFPNDVSPSVHLRAAPTIPAEFIAGLSSDLAEDPASSWGTGIPIAYASRWKTTIPAGGRRGQINEAQSEITLDGAKIVFDFNEDQGNGTINSLAICRLAPPKFGYDTAPLSCRAGHAGLRSGMDPVEIDSNWRQVLGYSPDMTTMYAFDGTTMKIREYDMATNAAGPDDMGVVDQSAITTATDGTYLSPTLSGLIWSSSTSANGVQYNYYISSPKVVRDGDTYYVAYHDRRGSLNVGSWVRSTGVRNWWTQIPSGTTGANNGSAGVCLVGGKLYATSSTVSTSIRDAAYAIHRINPATGAVEATIPFGDDPSGNEILSLGGIDTDGTDLYAVTTVGIVKMSTAGVILDYYGQPSSLSWTETGLTPWPTSAGYIELLNPSGDRDAYYITATAANSTARDSNHGDSASMTTGTGLIHVDSTGKLWSYEGYLGGASPTLAALDGANIFSRAVLDTTVTKSNSSTMKWTYEVTFPSEWRTPTAHALPPS